MTRRMVEERERLAELLFAELSDRAFHGLVRGLAAMLTRLRAELSTVEAHRSGPRSS